MEIKRIAVGMHQANCYVVSTDDDVFIIDPGARGDRIKTYLDPQRSVTAILLTHGHFDHIGAVDFLAYELKCPVYIHEEDIDMITHPDSMFPAAKNIRVDSEMTLFKEGHQRIGSTDFNVLFTPGHTKGSVLLILGENLFSGDVLFLGSIGRTDLDGGSDREMKSSLRLIKTLDKKLIVHPGHGLPTTLENELKTNPYLKF